MIKIDLFPIENGAFRIGNDPFLIENNPSLIKIDLFPIENGAFYIGIARLTISDSTNSLGYSAY